MHHHHHRNRLAGFQVCLKQAIPFLGCVYNNVCQYSFNVFKCQQLRDLTWVMRAAPAVVCYESDEHRVMIAVSIAALIFYVAGLPTVILCTVCYARKYDKLKHEDYLQVVGLFYKEYGVCKHATMSVRLSSMPEVACVAESEYFFWDVVFLMRRFFLSLCAVVFSGQSNAQYVWIVIFCSHCRFSFRCGFGIPKFASAALCRVSPLLSWLSRFYCSSCLGAKLPSRCLCLSFPRPRLRHLSSGHFCSF